MYEITVIVVCAIVLILLKIFLNVSFKKIKNIGKGTSKELQDISNKIPKSEEICKDILKKIDNEKVKIKVEPEYNSCLYTIYNNTITIGKFQQDYMKPQTLAHECIHSCQNKKTLWFNFIFTNIYIIYYITIIILAFLLKNAHINICCSITLIFMGVIQYVIRFTLENEAMLKAKYLAKEYIEEKKILTESEKNLLLSEYDRVNNICIPFVNYSLISASIIKIIIYSVIVILNTYI